VVHLRSMIVVRSPKIMGGDRSYREDKVGVPRTVAALALYGPRNNFTIYRQLQGDGSAGVQ
jgi:hypothetical protein